MTRSRSFPLTIPILAVGLIGMCGFLWFEYRQAKQKARPAVTVNAKNLSSTGAAGVSRDSKSAAILVAMKTSLAGTSEDLTADQTEQLARLLAADESDRLSPAMIFGAQRFLSAAQVATLKIAYAEIRQSPIPTPAR